MIFSAWSHKKKQLVNRIIFACAILFLALGFLPGWLPYQWGLILFVFAMVVAGIIKIIIPEPEPPAEQSVQEFDEHDVTDD